MTTGNTIMKNFVTIILLTLHLLALRTCLQATPSTTLFEEGNRVYDKQTEDGANYLKAIDKYKEMLESGYENGELHYNMGNAYYKVGDIASAIASYRRAERFIGNDEDLAKNLKIVRSAVLDKLETKPILPFMATLNNLQNSFNIYSIRFACIMTAFSLAFILAALMFHPGNTFRTILLTIFCGGCIYLSILIFFFIGISNKNPERGGVINTDTVAILSSPDENLNSIELFKLHRGAEISIEKASGKWLEISVSKEKKGWLKKKSIIEI